MRLRRITPERLAELGLLKGISAQRLRRWATGDRPRGRVDSLLKAAREDLEKAIPEVIPGPEEVERSLSIFKKLQPVLSLSEKEWLFSSNDFGSYYKRLTELSDAKQEKVQP